MQGPVVKCQEGRRQPVDPYRAVQEVLQPKQEERCAHILNYQIKQINVKSVHALGVVGLFVVELVQVVILLRVHERVQRSKKKDVTQHQQCEERHEDLSPASQSERDC